MLSCSCFCVKQIDQVVWPQSGSISFANSRVIGILAVLRTFKDSVNDPARTINSACIDRNRSSSG